VQTISDDLHHPWAMTFLPDGRLLVTERRGRLWLVDPDSGARKEIGGTPTVEHRNQGGLLDVALHPRFAETGWVYLTWAGRCGDGNASHLGRGRLEGYRLVAFETLFVATPCVDSGIHFGSRLAFDPDGHLFMTVGDRGERERAQDLTDHNGSVLRLRDDGRVPSDNPFVGREDAQPAIYSYGHRNPQGATVHPDTGRLWIHEHGPRGGDEINLPLAGENFGWPIQTYGREYYGPEIAPDEVKEGLHESDATLAWRVVRDQGAMSSACRWPRQDIATRGTDDSPGPEGRALSRASAALSSLERK